jgi:RNA polymerase sigma factor (sigma-70 family)
MDERAWDDLVRFYADELQRDIWASMRKRGLPADLIDDVQQETWRVAVQKIGEFEAATVDKLYNWLRVIALNRVRMLKRKQRGDMISFDDFESDEFEGGVSLDYFLYEHDLSSGSPEQKVLLFERLAALDSALDELSARNREILLRRLLSGETPRELASEYGLPARTISTILLRAKQTLEKHLSHHELFMTEEVLPTERERGKQDHD